MADYEDGPYVIIERRTGSFGTFVWGLLLGAAAALLYAPRSGRETRRELTDSAVRLRDKAETRVREVQRSVNETVEDVRRQVEEGIDSARRAVDTGRQAARASRDDVERRVRSSAAAFRGEYDPARSAAAAGRPDLDDAMDEDGSGEG
ncbi:MAG TPA: YtxH domain-containing protein [Longimicrobiales bacterium]|nr:YtxH domain-containing protein [Longimicrobiales bacterium]